MVSLHGDNLLLSISPFNGARENTSRRSRNKGAATPVGELKTSGRFVDDNHSIVFATGAARNGFTTVNKTHTKQQMGKAWWEDDRDGFARNVARKLPPSIVTLFVTQEPSLSRSS